ncbi:MAG: hypothetical protein HY717_14910 [Planctomycetes bacterium]|nr:hypothetical protein [Planctomycetota bacterium]
MKTQIFSRHRYGLWRPRCMREPPALDWSFRAGPPAPRTALLVNPFYPKDPVASFGKHVLTPALALTSIAGATPPEWGVRYWDENLLQGHPPKDPFPSVVGITVHLTFARRAYELARWYRERGAKVVLGGLHVMSCPDEAAPHADAIAIGEGVQLWPLAIRWGLTAFLWRPLVEAARLRHLLRRCQWKDEEAPQARMKALAR